MQKIRRTRARSLQSERKESENPTITKRLQSTSWRFVDDSDSVSQFNVKVTDRSRGSGV